MPKHFFTFIVCSFILFSCQTTTTKEKESINGIWESIGSGWIMEISDSTTYQLYDITSISCIPRRKGLLKEMLPALSIKNDTLSLLKGVITYKFSKKKTLPTHCKPTVSELKNTDPLYNFEVFAENIKEHYAFFELNQIDWDSLYISQKSKLTSQSTELEFYQVIEETLELLGDNHAFLEASDSLYEALEASSTEKEKIEDSTEKLSEYGDIQVAGMVANHHLQEDLTRDYRLRFPLIQWGKMNDSIGYIQVKTMWLFANLEVPQQRIDAVGYVDAFVETFHKMYDGQYINEEVSEVAKIMDMVMTDLSQMQSMVIDIRFNGGGQDAVSFEILSRFIPEKELLVATQQLKYGRKHTATLPIYIKGTKNAYTKPLYVLTSPQTGSAAEAFSIATMAMPTVKRIGSATSGATSTSLEKKLPNGWIVALSNEVYMDTHGNSYENKGIPVTYELNYLKDRQAFFRSIVNNLDADKHNILQAIEQLENE
ncbi:S41 family peptidase [Kordia zhangzhouensis]|uniref:S41 family peptidase n=1 Tax=Kordia zhangzhouensis TaxID=1620405 RepID=UPI00062953C7|nr:S41 family peptidase [Kordia zhangzhouensis]